LSLYGTNTFQLFVSHEGSSPEKTFFSKLVDEFKQEKEIKMKLNYIPERYQEIPNPIQNNGTIFFFLRKEQ